MAADGNPAQKVRGGSLAVAAAFTTDNRVNTVGSKGPCLGRHSMLRNFTRTQAATWGFILALMILLASCEHKPETPSAAKLFATPEEAGDAVFASAKSGNQDELRAIFGPDSKELLFSGDPVEDKNTLQAF